MIGADTNVLLRYILHDDPAQAKRVDAFVEQTSDQGDRLFVDDLVVCEIVWTLRSGYGLGHSTITKVLDKLLNTALFAFEDRDLLFRALDAYRNGAGDFADYMIGFRNARAGCDHTVTFDRALRGQPSFTIL